MARTQVVTILFCDLVSSTERRARMGDDAFDDFSAQLFVTLRAAIADFGGREVSNAGDGMMVVFTESAAEAVSCAREMHRNVAALDADDPPRLRIGISCGEVAQDGDNYSGMPIVEAARLESAATPGQTLANAVVRTLVGTRRAFRFRDVGQLTLKGIPQPLGTVEVLDDVVADLPDLSPPSEPKDERKRALIAVAIVAIIAVIAVAAGALVLTNHSSHHDAAVATPGGVPTPVGYAPTYAATKCPADTRKETPEAACGFLTVPENRAKPSGRKIRLLVLQAPPRTAVAPGTAPNIDVCGCNNLATSLARDHATLIQFGGRGFTNSDPVLTCPEMVAVTRPALTRPIDDSDVARQERTALARCRTRIDHAGIDPAQYNVETSSADVLDLMTALHIRLADFTASELTSNVVYGVLRRAPDAVRTMTLDNPAPPGKTALTDPIGDLSQAFNLFVDQCKSNAQCAGSYPELADAYRRVYAKYAAHPVLVSTPNPDDSSLPPISVLLDGPRIAQALTAALRNPDTYRLIPAVITEPSTAPLIAGQVLQGDYYTWHDDAPWGALASYYCSYDINTFDPNAIALEARTLPQFDTHTDQQWVNWCKAWSVPDVSDVVSSDIASPVPTLLFRGDLAPTGTSDWTSALQSTLASSQSAIFPTLSEGLVAQGPPCLSALRREFLANPTAKLATTACEALSPKITFDAPSP